MAEGKCTVCGYIYDETIGDKKREYLEGQPLIILLVCGHARSTGQEKRLLLKNTDWKKSEGRVWSIPLYKVAKPYRV